MLYTDMKTGYTQQQKELNKNLRGVSEWEEYFLQPLRETYDTGVSQIQAASNYDISSAYANYKKQQLSLLQSQGLSEGFKEKLEKQLKSEYETRAYETELTAAENLAKLQSNVEKTYEENQKSLEARSQTASDLTAAAAKYLGYSDEQLLSALGVDLEGSYGVGWYGIDDEGYRTLTARGQEELLRTLSSSDFAETLKSENPALYKQFAENPALMMELITGTKETSYNPISDKSIKRRLDIKKNVAKGTGDTEKYGDWVAFSDIFDSYDAGIINEEDLVSTIVRTYELEYPDKKLTQDTLDELTDWAKSIKKGKSKTFNKNDAKKLTSIFEAIKTKEPDDGKVHINTSLL